MRLVAWLLAAVCATLALWGFSDSGLFSAATLGFPGSSATFFFLTLARSTSLAPDKVRALGGWPLSAAGALLSVGLLVGASSLPAPGLGIGRLALPLSLVGDPLLAVASLRLSTATERKAPWYGVAVAAMGLAAASAMLLVRLWPVYRPL